MKIIASVSHIKWQLIFFKILFISVILTLTVPSLGQQRAIDSLKKALEHHPQQDTIRVKLLNKLAYEYYSTSLSYLRLYGNQALKLAIKIKFRSGVAVAYKNIGLGYIAADANPMALEYFDKSLKTFESMHDKLNSARVLNNIGYYYGVIKDHKQELSYLLQAYDNAKDSNDTLVKQTILGNVGNSYEANNLLAEARKYYNQELVLSKAIKLSSGIVSSYSNLGSVSFKEKQYTQALNYCDKVLAIKNTSDNFRPRNLANILTLEGKIYYALKDYDKARAAFMQSTVIANNLGKAEYLSPNYYNLYLLDSIKGDYKSALKNYAQHIKLDDSLTNVNKNQVLALYQIKFDSQKRIVENERLKIEEEKNQAIISQQHKNQVILLIGLIIILGGGIYLFHINNQVKAKNSIINEQNQVLENNNLVKDKLFSVISHDLRSPITQVVGLLNLWEEGEMSQEEMAVLTPTVKNNILHTLELLDNLLIWSKNQFQGFNFNPLQFDLRGLMEENLKSLQRLIYKKSLKVENNIDEGTIVFADMEMIKIVLRNLISNAIKFTPVNGIISLSSEVNDQYIVICVADTGIGIKPKDMAKIFSFTSHTTLGTSNEKGTGIGLKICRDFIELNNGKIWMESKENVGSKFYVSLPLHHINASEPAQVFA